MVKVEYGSDTARLLLLADAILVGRHVTALPYKVPSKIRLAPMFKLCCLYN